MVKVSNLINHLGNAVPETVRNLYSQEQTPHFDMDAGDFPIAQLRGGKGLPKKGWDEVKTQAHQTIYKIADNITQNGKYINNISTWQKGHIGEVIYQKETFNNKQMEVLKNLKKLKDRGIITEAEFEVKKKKILEKI